MPGKPRFVLDVVGTAEGLIEQLGARSFNLYRPPRPLTNQLGSATRWLRLAEIVCPEEETHEWMLDWCAFLVQRAEEMPRAALVLAAAQGIGKDAFLHALREAVGPWNVSTLSPGQFMGRFNTFTRSKLMVINEDRANFFEGGAQAFYDRLKEYTASPPDTITVEEKYMPLVSVRKASGVVITTNVVHEMHLEDDDRRLGIAKATAKQGWHIAAGEPDFFTNYFAGLERGDGEAVRRFLLARDLSRYDPAKPPPISEGKRQVLLANQAGDDALSGALDRLGNPDVVFGPQLRSLIGSTLLFGNPKRFEREMLRQGYTAFPHPSAKQWKFEVSTDSKGKSKTETTEAGKRSPKTSRKAYVRTELMDQNPKEILSKVEARGRQWAAGELDADSDEAARYEDDLPF